MNQHNGRSSEAKAYTYENSKIYKQLLLKFNEVKLVNRILKIVDIKKESKKFF